MERVVVGPLAWPPCVVARRAGLGGGARPGRAAEDAISANKVRRGNTRQSRQILSPCLQTGSCFVVLFPSSPVKFGKFTVRSPRARAPCFTLSHSRPSAVDADIPQDPGPRPRSSWQPGLAAPSKGKRQACAAHCLSWRREPGDTTLSLPASRVAPVRTVPFKFVFGERSLTPAVPLWPRRGAWSDSVAVMIEAFSVESKVPRLAHLAGQMRTNQRLESTNQTEVAPGLRVLLRTSKRAQGSSDGCGYRDDKVSLRRGLLFSKVMALTHT